MSLASTIAKQQAAIFRTEDKLAAMSTALGPDQCPCCVGAAYGGTIGPYDRLQRRRDRQEAWLRILVAKRDGNQAEQVSAAKAYGELTRRHFALESRS